jgi:hypothetical protein
MLIEIHRSKELSGIPGRWVPTDQLGSRDAGNVVGDHEGGGIVEGFEL